MATNKNITMRQFNGTDYDTLYPRTTPSQVSGLYDSVYTKDQVNNLFNQCVLLDGSRPMTGNLNMNNHYIPNVLTGSSGADAARKDYVDNLIASCAKIQTGSYVGTGTYGPSNPVTLTFNFVPYFFVLSVSNIAEHQGANANYADLSTGYNDGIWLWQHGIATYRMYARYQIIWTQQNSRLTWYYNGTNEYVDGNYQMNESNKSYYWIAFG